MPRHSVKFALEITIMYTDLPDLIELRVQVASQAFSGEANLYAGPNALRELASALRGFPSSAQDTRQVELGTFDPNRAGGGARLRFRCVDLPGHAALEAEIRSDPQAAGAQSVTLSVPIEPASLDAFVHRLEDMKLKVGERASLAARN